MLKPEITADFIRGLQAYAQEKERQDEERIKKQQEAEKQKRSQNDIDKEVDLILRLCENAITQKNEWGGPKKSIELSPPKKEIRDKVIAKLKSLGFWANMGEVDDGYCIGTREVLTVSW